MMRRSTERVVRWTLCTAFLLGLGDTSEAWGQSPQAPVHVAEIPLDSPAIAIAIPPGGYLRIQGVVTLQEDGTVFDAATETSASGRSVDGGLIDAAASGLVLQDRDPAQHAYTYRASGVDGTTCRALRMGQTCVALRLPMVAAKRLRDIDELRESLEGQLMLEIHTAAVASPPPPTYASPPPIMPPYHYSPPPEPSTPLWAWAVGGASTTGLLVALFALFVALRRRKKQTTLGRVQASTGRLRKRLGTDPQRSRLLNLVEELNNEATSLAETEEKLVVAVKKANPEELERRKAQLQRDAEDLKGRGGAEAGQQEIDGAVEIVEGQLERCRKWDMQRWRSGARLERIATRLEALEVELNDPSPGQSSSNDKLLDALQEELDLARAGEDEAEHLLQSSSASDGNGS